MKRPGRHKPTATSWDCMIQRCTYEKDRRWSAYGGRGISVCERWLTSFAAFLEDMGERPDGMTLDRIDVNGNYEPGNCRWATRVEQMQNTRRGPSRRVYGPKRTVGQPPKYGAPMRERINLQLTEAERAEIEAAVPIGHPVGRWIVNAALERARKQGERR